ncbi:MAG: hypothetical protein ACPL7I_07055 [Myxococcota bacterium]
MLRNCVSQNSTQNINRYHPVFPGRYLYFDRFFQRLSEQKKPLSLTINLFDGRVSVTISTDENSILIKGDKELKVEVMRHISLLPIARNFIIKVI